MKDENRIYFGFYYSLDKQNDLRRTSSKFWLVYCEENKKERTVQSWTAIFHNRLIFQYIRFTEKKYEKYKFIKRPMILASYEILATYKNKRTLPEKVHNRSMIGLGDSIK